MTTAGYINEIATTTFQQAVTITVYYGGDNLAGLYEADLALHYWDGQQWVEVATEIDTVSKRLTATVDHFTIYALLEKGGKVYLPVILRE